MLGNNIEQTIINYELNAFNNTLIKASKALLKQLRQAFVIDASPL